MSRLGHEDREAQSAKVVYLPRVGLAWEPWVPPTNHPVAREVELGGSHRDARCLCSSSTMACLFLFSYCISVSVKRWPSRLVPVFTSQAAATQLLLFSWRLLSPCFCK